MLESGYLQMATSGFSVSWIGSMLIPAILILAVVGLIVINKQRRTSQPLRIYQYTRRKYLISRAEHQLYTVLSDLVGSELLIFPQIHLDRLVDHAVVGQNWKGALSHIQRKSVDFVLCDPRTLSPLLAIELDDASHHAKERVQRDREVERILGGAGLPLLRIPARATYLSADIATLIHDAMIKNRVTHSHSQAAVV